MSLSQNEADLASLSCLDHRVRGRRYAFVCGRTEPPGQPAGPDEAAAAVGIGRALAVYYLDKLVQSALLTASYRRPWHDDAGTVRMRSCPFRRVAERQPGVICDMNLALIQGLVAGAGAGSRHPVPDPPRASHAALLRRCGRRATGRELCSLAHVDIGEVPEN